MTQLFDTNTYEHRTLHADDQRGTRRLRILPSADPAADDRSARSTQWRLDEHTIEVGRRGIVAARQALQDAARSSAPKRARTAA